MPGRKYNVSLGISSPVMKTNLIVLMELLLQRIGLMAPWASFAMHIQREHTEKHMATSTSHLSQGPEGR